GERGQQAGHQQQPRRGHRVLQVRRRKQLGQQPQVQQRAPRHGPCVPPVTPYNTDNSSKATYRGYVKFVLLSDAAYRIWQAVFACGLGLQALEVVVTVRRAASISDSVPPFDLPYHRQHGKIVPTTSHRIPRIESSKL